MTDIRFHTGVEDRTLYGCRLLRKAARQGARVLVRGEALQVDLLDKALWTFEAQDFVPHHRLRPGQALDRRLHRTPIWLLSEGDPWPEDLAPARVLVQWGSQHADDAPHWDRVIEVVGLDVEDRLQARQRWRAYEAQGWKPQALDVAGARS